MSVYAQEYGYFFNSNNNDRAYNAESFEEWLRPFFVGGVFAGCLQVQAQSTPDMTVTVKPGYANLNGKPAYWPDNNIVEIARASGVYNRIDTVVLRRDNTNRTISIEVVTGNASNNPQPTAPTRNSDIYELVLAQVYVGVGVTRITAANITDKRPDASVCGYVMSTIQTPDFSELYAQFQAQAADALQSQETDFDSWKQNFEDDAEEWEDNFQKTAQNWYQVNTSDFAAWFESIKDQLDTDQAGHLQLEIDTEIAARKSADNELHKEIEYGAGIYPDVEDSGGGTYNIGDRIRYNGKVYECNTDGAEVVIIKALPGGTTVVINLDQWDQVTIGDYTTSLSDQIAEKVNTTDIVDGLTSTDADKPLSANQGKVLSDTIAGNVPIDVNFGTISGTGSSQTITKNVTGMVAQMRPVFVQLGTPANVLSDIVFTPAAGKLSVKVTLNGSTTLTVTMAKTGSTVTATT